MTPCAGLPLVLSEFLPGGRPRGVHGLKKAGCVSGRIQTGRWRGVDVGWRGADCRKCSETRTLHTRVSETDVKSELEEALDLFRLLFMKHVICVDHCRGRRRNCWMDSEKECTSLPMTEQLTMAARRKDWKRISAQSSLMSD